MNPFDLVTRPVSDLAAAITMPLRAVFVVGLCGFINWMTFPGVWWVKWVALGMGIAVLVAWARAVRVLLVLALVALAGGWVLRRWGPQAGAVVREWAERLQPRRA